MVILVIFVGFIILYLLAIMPRMINRPDYTPFKKKDYAHRGLHDADIPENSLCAFEKAAAAGYGIELDVQLTKDKLPVVFHDFTLKRVCGERGRVDEYTYEQLLQFRLGNSDEQIPLLSEVLSLVDGRVPLLVEFKIERTDTSVCRIANEILSVYKGRYCIESFNPIGLLWYRRNRPEIVRGQLSSDFPSLGEVKDSTFGQVILKNLLFNCITKPDFISYDFRGAHCIARTLCQKLYRCMSFAYTLKSQEDADRVRDCFDRFIFEGYKPIG